MGRRTRAALALAMSIVTLTGGEVAASDEPIRLPTTFQANSVNGSYGRYVWDHPVVGDIVTHLVTLEVGLPGVYNWVDAADAQFSCRTWVLGEVRTECHLVVIFHPDPVDGESERYAASAFIDLESLQRGEAQRLRIFDGTGVYENWKGFTMQLKPNEPSVFPTGFDLGIYPVSID